MPVPRGQLAPGLDQPEVEKSHANRSLAGRGRPRARRLHIQQQQQPVRHRDGAASVVGGAPASVNGPIQNYTTGPGGQQNGFVLATGQRVRYPEAMGSKVSDQFPPNTQVQVTGHMTTDADGRQVLQADQITDKAPTPRWIFTAAPLSSVAGDRARGGWLGHGRLRADESAPEPQPATSGTPPPGGR